MCTDSRRWRVGQVGQICLSAVHQGAPAIMKTHVNHVWDGNRKQEASSNSTTTITCLAQFEGIGTSRAEADFGQTNFGHPYLTVIGPNLGGQLRPDRFGPKLVFQSLGSPKFRAFFHLPPPDFNLFSPTSGRKQAHLRSRLNTAPTLSLVCTDHRGMRRASYKLAGLQLKQGVAPDRRALLATFTLWDHVDIHLPTSRSMVECSDEGQNLFAMTKCLTFHRKKTFLEVRSNAPIPSTPTTVAFVSASVRTWRMCATGLTTRFRLECELVGRSCLLHPFTSPTTMPRTPVWLLECYQPSAPQSAHDFFRHLVLGQQKCCLAEN